MAARTAEDILGCMPWIQQLFSHVGVWWDIRLLDSYDQSELDSLRAYYVPGEHLCYFSLSLAVVSGNGQALALSRPGDLSPESDVTSEELVRRASTTSNPRYLVVMEQGLGGFFWDVETQRLTIYDLW